MTAAAAVLDRRLAPIGLDELVERAPLLARLDRKYILPTAVLPALLAGLTDDVRVLEIDGRQEFGYRSRYLDTPELDSYLATAHRRRRRFKLRVRSYVDTDQHYLEVKIRGRRGTTIKERMPCSGDLAHTAPGSQLDAQARDYTDAVLAAAGIRAQHLHFEPVLTTHYYRTTLFLPATGSRVTIDTGLSWALPDGTAARSLDRAIVETKSDCAVSQADRVLWSLRYRPVALSKYATGLAALRPELPANHWTPVLRKHFDALTEEGPR